MEVKTILTITQTKLLKEISSNHFIQENFYLTGGTALSEYYLHHRLSEDLDFFTQEEFDPQAIQVLLNQHKKILQFTSIDYQPSFNRNIYMVNFVDTTVKTEFTVFPFPPIENGRKVDELTIDSLLDIAVNKLFTIYQRPRTRDYIDLYLILKRIDETIPSLIKKAKLKFDWHVDPLTLGSQFLQCTEVADYPHMIIPIKDQDWQSFFIDESKKLEGNILK